MSCPTSPLSEVSILAYLIATGRYSKSPHCEASPSVCFNGIRKSSLKGQPFGTLPAEVDFFYNPHWGCSWSPQPLWDKPFGCFSAVWYRQVLIERPAFWHLPDAEVVLLHVRIARPTIVYLLQYPRVDVPSPRCEASLYIYIYKRSLYSSPHCEASLFCNCLQKFIFFMRDLSFGIYLQHMLIFFAPFFSGSISSILHWLRVILTSSAITRQTFRILSEEGVFYVESSLLGQPFDIYFGWYRLVLFVKHLSDELSFVLSILRGQPLCLNWQRILFHVLIVRHAFLS